MSARQEQKEQTRTRILETTLALIRRGGEDVTITAVATAAGLTERAECIAISGPEMTSSRRPGHSCASCSGRHVCTAECLREKLEYLDERSLRRRAAIADLLIRPHAW